MTDLLILAACWFGAHALRFEITSWPAPLGETPLIRRWWTLAVLLPVATLVLASCGLYRPRRTVTPRREAGEAIRGVLLLTIVMAVWSYALRLDIPRSALALFTLMAMAALAGMRLALGARRRARRRRGLDLTPAVIVGDGPLAAQLLARMRGDVGLGIVARGVISTGLRTPVEGAHPIVGHVDALQALAPDGRSEVAYVALEREESALERRVLARLSELSIPVRWVPGAPGRWPRDAQTEELGGLPIVYLTENPMRGIEGAIKRSFDGVAAAFALLVASPLMALIAVLIRIDSPGAPLYSQERLSLGGRRFQMWKFRTMRIDAEDSTGPVWPHEGDTRITRVGRWLRRCSLDELPQLWNVVCSEMSLVGPRPERPAFVERFEEHVPHYPLRLGVRAGITGWAQVHGLRGATPIDRRVEHDLFYLAHWSLGLDLRILMLTMWRLARGLNPG